jgi:LPXTG-site transpeptidase (sortase) family protein
LVSHQYRRKNLLPERESTVKLLSAKLLDAFLCAGLLLALVGIRPAYAAALTVTNDADSGAGSLRAAISSAGSGDTITFASSLSGDTITLASTLTIDKDLTIDGSSLAAPITISGNDAVLVMEVDSGKSLTLDALTIANGHGNVYGGGIHNYGHLTATNSTFSDNIATGNSTSGGKGGGIYNNGGGTLTVTDCTFSGNQATTGIAPGGGGISNDGIATVTNNTFSGNSAGYLGGGIFNSGTLTVANSTFSGNSADQGGGINNYYLLNVTDSTFTGNSATDGGGLYNLSSTLMLKDCTVSGNSADQGGGAYNDGTLIVTNSTFSNNSANEYGGGIINYNTLNVTNSTFSGNSADEFGGGIDNDRGGTLNYANTILANSTKGGDCYNDGGAIGTNTQNLIKNNASFPNDCGTPSLTGDPLLNSLSNNGGKTQTMALLSGSPAIDAGDDTTCAASPVNNQDQRGVTRPQGTHCDIGAYEYGPVIPVVNASTPAANATLTSLTTISVAFNQDMLHDGSSKAANNVANYLLVERGANFAFDTKSCKSGLQDDDQSVSLSSAGYNSGTLTATLTLARPLVAGVYDLFVCGTTSIWSVAGLELNNGAADAQIGFTLLASQLPGTGFAPGQGANLPAQALSQTYSSTGLTLDIPALEIETSIVGVPQTGDSWDVSWLGSDAGWLNGTAFPTWNGNSVITGHVWNADNTPGIFVDLKQLHYGDHILVHAFGQTYTYEVRENSIVSPDQSDVVLKHEDQAWITLLTCEDYNALHNTYSSRRMVRAVLVGVR